jgi:pyruvate,orthophosphate dikinase
MADMARLGIHIPPGFAISDVVCRRFLETGEIPDDAWEEIADAVTASGAAFSAIGHPRLFAVRSSPRLPMPGVLNAALYLGTTTELLTELATVSGEELAALVRLGFLESLGKLRGVPSARYHALVADLAGRAPSSTWEQSQIEAIADGYASLIIDESQRPIPGELIGQLREGIEGVFASWDGAEARRFRRRNEIDDDEGMAIVVHPMVFGEGGGDSGAGTVYSRDPNTGEPTVTGAYVAGVSRRKADLDHPGLIPVAGQPVFAEMAEVARRLEIAWCELTRIDFVREHGENWVVGARPAERTAQAAVRVAVELVDEGLLSVDAALLSVEPERLAGMLHPQLVAEPSGPPLARGVAASPGAASGPVVFSAVDAMAAADAGTPPILVLRQLHPGDLDGVAGAGGLITSHGGGTSHAAVAVRAAGTPSVTGVGELLGDASAVRFGDRDVHAGEWVTINGSTGLIYAGQLEIASPPGGRYLDRLLGWADSARRLGVWANADTALSAAAARAAGADGIGLARTEHMFQGERLGVVRRMLLADRSRDRTDALEELENLQIGDFEELLEAMDATPVVVRLLDPPVHEFLPSRVDLELEMAQRRAAGEPIADLEALDAAVAQWSEVNPMLGLRGVRLAVVIPEIYRVQVLAALEAVRRRLDAGGDPRLQLMIPLVGSIEELRLVRDMIEEEVHSAGRLLEIGIGTMIELPRAALMAGELALASDFFSFGTNDLTQTTMGLSRDDAEAAFLGIYLEQGLLAANPFQQIDPGGVGSLIQQAIAAGRKVNPGLEIGVCGEHGGDPVSIGYFHRWGVDYVSCSPPRLPIARLAAAQAALREE